MSIVQSLAHGPGILSHLAHSSNAVGLKKVVVPSVGWSHVVKKYWVGGDRRRGDSIRSSNVFVKGNASAERADSGEAGCDEVRAKIAKTIAHLIIRLLARGVQVEGRWRLDVDKEHGMLVEFHGENRDNVDCITGSPGKLRDDFEEAFDAKNVVQESSVRPVVGALIVGELRLVGGKE